MQFMKQKAIKTVEKIVEILIFLTGEAIKVALLALAFGFYLEGKRLEMWVPFIAGYMYQIIFYKLFLFPYISPMTDEKNREKIG